MSKGAIDCTFVLLSVHAYIKRAIERLLHFNEVYYAVIECTVILLNQRLTQMNEYFALMTGKRCSEKWKLACAQWRHNMAAEFSFFGSNREKSEKKMAAV